MAFLAATAYASGAAFAIADELATLDWPAIGVVSAAAALAVAVGLRSFHPSVLTQVGVLAWATALAGSSIAWIGEAFFTQPVSELTGLPTSLGANPLILVAGSAAWWLATAVIFGIIGLREARDGDRRGDEAALRRAAVSRFWAGLTAVIGLASAVSRSGYIGGDVYGRVLEPWVGVLALLVLSAVLVERAFRRDATSFIYAAALGLIIALTDFNLSYLSGSQEVALLLEGLILLGVGFAADRLRRRIGQVSSGPSTPGAPDEVLAEAI
jgi:hypothetical protein